MIIFKDGSIINHLFDETVEYKYKRKNNMKVLLMAVYDTKSKMHTQPVPCRTIEEGIRSFKATVLTEKHDFNIFAEDYSLWQIGTFDQESGHIEPMRPIQVAQALEFRKNIN